MRLLLAAVIVAIVLLISRGAAAPSAAQAPQASADLLAARVDQYAPKTRVVVLTDIANEPDDQMSMVRFLVYANQFDIEGLVATTRRGCETRFGRMSSTR
jgi:hypothetical protein